MEGGPNPCPEDEEFFNTPDAASMEEAIGKFMESLEGQGRGGFTQLDRLLQRLPVPAQKEIRQMTHAVALEGTSSPKEWGRAEKIYTLWTRLVQARTGVQVDCWEYK